MIFYELDVLSHERETSPEACISFIKSKKEIYCNDVLKEKNNKFVIKKPDPEAMKTVPRITVSRSREIVRSLKNPHRIFPSPVS